MNRMSGSGCPALGKVIVICVFTLALLGATSAASDYQEFDGSRQQHRRCHDDELTFTQLDFPGATATNAYGINNRGQIVGGFLDVEGISHGFLLDDGVYTQLDFPGAPQTQAQAINDRGQIVGIFGEAIEVAHGFLLEKGVYTQIDFPAATNTDPNAINNRGQIVGGFTDAGGATHGFLAR